MFLAFNLKCHESNRAVNSLFHSCSSLIVSQNENRKLTFWGSLEKQEIWHYILCTKKNWETLKWHTEQAHWRGIDVENYKHLKNMASQQFWCLSFMLTWIFVFFLPSLCSDMDAPSKPSNNLYDGLYFNWHWMLSVFTLGCVCTQICSYFCISLMSYWSLCCVPSQK